MTLNKNTPSLGMHALSGMTIPPKRDPLILGSLINKPNFLRAVLGRLLPAYPHLAPLLSSSASLVGYWHAQAPYVL